ncbi:alkylhydroperoxidase domain protein [Corynebacterium camporealensis]|uniref:alkylhydroperoxidase domain protein n=1 Tax=Corynebacterium camporealensis TaxID=161896 RepID=UPI0034CEE69A
MMDIINHLSTAPQDILDLRARRADAQENAQASFSALLEPENPGTFTYTERYAVAAFIAGITQDTRAYEFYAELLSDDSSLNLQPAITRGRIAGPYHDGEFVTFSVLDYGERLAAAFDFAHLLIFHPKDATPGAIGHLQEAGWSDDDIVSLAQLISFLAFQLRVIHGLNVLGGAEIATPEACEAKESNPNWQPGPRTELPDVVAPQGFVAHPLGWRPWVPAVPKDEMTEAQKDSLIKPERIDMPYFRLLARDPAALLARTRTDLDIFYNTDGGLGRAERELSATVTSRYNGCEYCASVHQARAKEEGGDAEAIDKLLADGPTADLGTTSWNALRDAALDLTATPVRFDKSNVEGLRNVGLNELAIIDVINSASFFNWANRLMLTLGAPDVPRRFR